MTDGRPMERLRRQLSQTALGPALVIWAFGYALVDVFAFIMGRAALGSNFLSSMPMFALGVGLTLALDWLRHALQRRNLLLRWALFGLAICGATVVQALFDVYWLRWLALNLLPSWQEWAVVIDLQRLFTVGILYLWTFCLALTLLWAARFSTKFEASTARAARAEAAAVRAEAAALRLQLNPHFLFNTLNSISSLVHLDRKGEAEEMIDRLCDFLRASLNADPMADVPLAEEIDAIDAYLGIEAARFGERLDAAIDIAPGLSDAPVPNFILQPLVENAIKHGVAKAKGVTRLHVRARADGEMLELSVINESPDDAEAVSQIYPSRPSTGIGLANIRQRLANRFGDAARLETTALPDGHLAVIRLPLGDSV